MFHHRLERSMGPDPGDPVIAMTSTRRSPGVCAKGVHMLVLLAFLGIPPWFLAGIAVAMLLRNAPSRRRLALFRAGPGRAPIKPQLQT